MVDGLVDCGGLVYWWTVVPSSNSHVKLQLECLPQNIEESNVGELLTPAEIQRLQLLKVTGQGRQSWSPKVANLKHIYLQN